MRCLHPHCPMGHGLPSWTEVVDHPEVATRAGDKPALLAALNRDYARAPANPAITSPVPTANAALLRRLMRQVPCLYNQVDGIQATPRGTAHLCEITLGARIGSTNVHQAFLIQHPRAPLYSAPPVIACTDGGTIMEMLCSEVLESAGVPRMEQDGSGWPVWKMPGHILLNEGQMGGLRAFGDLLVPCAPTNLVISVKSEAARERLLYSSNSIEGIGFGFFNDASEFWSIDRMRLYKRMGFSVIYMPANTHAQIEARLASTNAAMHAVNVNGTPLYRRLDDFGADMARVVGKSSLEL